MRKHRYRILIGFIGMLMIATLIVGPASATVVWQDDFNDGNLDGWSFDLGYDYQFVVTDGAMYGDATGDQFAWIRHASTLTEGQWSFDFTQTVSADDHADFIVMANGSLWSYTGWGIHISMYSDMNAVVYIASYDGTLWTGRGNLVTYIHDARFNGTWTHFDITVDSDGKMNVFMDSEHILTYSGITCDACDLLVIEGDDCGFDNVVTDDTITLTPPSTETTTTTSTTPDDTTPPPTPIDMTTMLLVAGGGVAVIIVIVVILKMRS